MRNLTIAEQSHIVAGFVPLILAVVAVFTLPKIINDTRKEYNQWGEQLGQAAFDFTNNYDPNRG